MIGSGQHSLAAMTDHRSRDIRAVRCHRHPADVRRLRALHDMHDHWQAKDVLERLARQPRRCHPGRDQDQGLGGRHRQANSVQIPNARYAKR